jgi:hypothetical protein
VIRWWCGGLNNTEVDRLPSDCEGRQGIHAEIRFAACWDGRSDSPNHKDHLAYRKETGQCPDSHPFRLPRILMHVDFDVRGKIGRNLRSSDKITLASGGMWTMHADYMFAWDPFRLDFLVHNCLNGRQNCKLEPPDGEVALEEEPPLTVGEQPSETTPKDEAGKGKPEESETRLKILDTSPESPRAGMQYSVKFAALKGDERLEMQAIFCDAVVGKKVATLKRKDVEGRIGTCVWQVPSASGETFRATVGAHVDGRHVLKTVEEKIR